MFKNLVLGLSFLLSMLLGIVIGLDLSKVSVVESCEKYNAVILMNRTYTCIDKSEEKILRL